MFFQEIYLGLFFWELIRAVKIFFQGLEESGFLKNIFRIFFFQDLLDRGGVTFFKTY